MKLLKALLILTAASLFILVVGPFLLPVQPAQGTLPVEQLADPDSHFAEIQGFQVHYKTAGQGNPVQFLLHGFLGSTFSWREVLEPLAGLGRVVAFDRTAFGLTERPLEWETQNPYSAEAQVELTIGLMDEIGVEQAVLVGHSLGGAVATLTALTSPERVQALVLIAPAVYVEERFPSWIRPLLYSPQMDRLGPLLVRSVQDLGIELAGNSWHDPSKLTPSVLAGYTRPLSARDWDRGLWEFVRASRSVGLPERLGELDMPVLVIAGDDDRVVPTQESARLAEEIPGSQLVIIPQCGHVPMEECPQAFLEAMRVFLADLEE